MVDSTSGDLRTVGAAAPVAAVSPGAILRAAREQQGVHLAVLAASLKVVPKKIELLEADRFDELPDATFARALALSMCKVLKIDPEPVMARLPQSVSARLARLDHVAQGLNQPFRDRESWRDDSGWQRMLSWPLIAAGLLVVAALVVYFLPAGGWSRSASDDASPQGGGSAASAAAAVNDGAASGAVSDAASASADPLRDGLEQLAETTGSPGASAAAAVLSSMDPAASAAPVSMGAGAFAPASAAASAPAGTPGAAAVSARVDSWVDVRDAGGRVLVSRTLAAGETVDLDGALPLRVIIGNAQGTALRFRGQPVPLDASTRDNVARLELK